MLDELGQVELGNDLRAELREQETFAEDLWVNPSPKSVALGIKEPSNRLD